MGSLWDVAARAAGLNVGPEVVGGVMADEGAGAARVVLRAAPRLRHSILTAPAAAPVISPAVACPSGRRCDTRNVVWGQTHRGFKSHRHRQSDEVGREPPQAHVRVGTGAALGISDEADAQTGSGAVGSRTTSPGRDRRMAISSPVSGSEK